MPEEPSTLADVAAARCRAVGLGPVEEQRPPAAVVEDLFAVQSQETALARWAIGIRAGCDDAVVRAALDAGEILRTHVLRPTWHFISPADLRWVQRLTADRVMVKCRSWLASAGITEELTTTAFRVFEAALADGQAATKAELKEALTREGLALETLQVSFLTMLAEIRNLITSGPDRGRQHTHMLLDARAPGPGLDLSGDEAWAAFALRYLRSHGPATERDLAWWASLTLTQARHAIHLVETDLESATIDGLTLWFDPAREATPAPAPAGVRLLHTFDELFVGYADSRRAAYLAPDSPTNLDPNQTALPILVDGAYRGWWKLRAAGGRLQIQVAPADAPGMEARVAAAVEEYVAFAGSAAEVEWVGRS